MYQEGPGNENTLDTKEWIAKRETYRITMLTFLGDVGSQRLHK